MRTFKGNRQAEKRVVFPTHSALIPGIISFLVAVSSLVKLQNPFFRKNAKSKVPLTNFIYEGQAHLATSFMRGEPTNSILEVL